MSQRFLLSLVLLGLLALGPLSASAQAPVITNPTPVLSTNLSSTIASTNVFQSVIVQNTALRRSGCTIVNYGSNTMWVFFGALASATKAASVQLAANQPLYCQIFGIVLQDQVSITGTSGDAFFAAQQ